MAVTAIQVKELRAKTGAGMMECKKALVESAGDVSAAVDTLRKSGIAKAGSRADRRTSEGRVGTYVHPGDRVGVMIEVNCETDFVARTDDFGNLVRDLAMQVAAAGAEYVRPEEVPAERVQKEREIFRAQLLEEGKPENMVDKIVEGKLNKFYSEICLLEQAWIRDDKQKVDELVKTAASKTGENIQVRRFTRYQLGQD
jgi:elongation factor Ts